MLLEFELWLTFIIRRVYRTPWVSTFSQHGPSGISGPLPSCWHWVGAESWWGGPSLVPCWLMESVQWITTGCVKSGTEQTIRYIATGIHIRISVEISFIMAWESMHIYVCDQVAKSNESLIVGHSQISERPCSSLA